MLLLSHFLARQSLGDGGSGVGSDGTSAFAEASADKEAPEDHLHNPLGVKSMLPILLTLTAAFAILAWSDLPKALLLLIAVLPSYLLRTEIFGFPTTLLELLIVTFLMIWFLKRRPLIRTLVPQRSWMIPMILLLLAATISVFVAPDRLAALGVWKAYFIEPILLFLVVRYELTTENSLNIKLPPGHFMSTRLFQSLGVSAIILSVIAIAQWLTGAGIPIPWDIERRVTSVFEYPNALGLFLGPIVVIGILSHLSGVQKTPKNIFWMTVAFFSSTAIILAQSEAAIVSVIATILLASILNKKTRVVSSSLFVLLVFLVLLVPPLGTKLTLQDYSGGVRLSQWSETADMLKDHWFLGAGLGGYPTALKPYHQATHLEIFQYPHNLLLNIWVELGVLGLIAFALLSWRVLRHVSTTYNLQPPVLIPFLALLQMTIHGLVDVPYFKNDLAVMTWILLAILIAYARPSAPTTSS